MPQIGLQRPRIVAPVGQRVAAGMPEHVRKRLEAQLRLDPCTFDHSGEAGGRKRSAALRREHEGRWPSRSAAREPEAGRLCGRRVGAYEFEVEAMRR